MKSSKFIPLLVGTVLFVVLAAACAQAPTPEPTAVPPSPTALQLPTAAPAAPTSAPTTAPAAGASGDLSGGALYAMSCAACHGADRAGSTFTLDGQTIAVPALTWDALNKTFTTQPNRGTAEQQVGIAITKGQDETGGDLNTMMPRWSALSPDQVQSLVQYLETASGTPPTLTPAATNLQGAQLFQTSCSACHGADRGGSTFTLDGQTIAVPALTWNDLNKTFTTQPSRGTAEQQVGVAITQGLDETGGELNAMMPRWSALSPEQVQSLIQYLKTVGQ